MLKIFLIVGGVITIGCIVYSIIVSRLNDKTKKKYINEVKEVASQLER